MPVNGHGADLYPWRNEGFAPPPPAPSDDLIIKIESDAEPKSTIDAKTGALLTELPNGELRIDYGGAAKKKAVSVKDHDANLAAHVSASELSRISNELLDGIESDRQSRQDWIKRRADGIKHLALKVEAPGAPSADADTAVEGQSTVRTPMMLDAVVRFQANAGGELLPAGGPTKVSNDTPQPSERQALLSTSGLTPPDTSDADAELLEKLMNHYLTVIDRPFYSDTKRMFFMLGYGGCSFKKVYRCPILRRPVSRSIDAEDIIVSNEEVSLQECGRVTHKSMMRQGVFKRMVKEGQYIADDVGAPIPEEISEVKRAKDDVAGFSAYAARAADYRHTIYEVYCELDIEGIEDSEEAGFPVPYRVTIDKDSTKIVEIRRNWEEGDERYLQLMPIVKYIFVEGMGFYGIGLLNIMGNATAAVTTAWRLAMDCGAFASWPGFMYTEQVGRQDTMNMRVGMGTGIKVQTNGAPIGDSVLPLPYKDVTAGLLQIMNTIAEEGRRVGGTPELMVGEGRQDVPVGTTLAMLDQAVKVIDSVHKGMHISQAEELELLREQFKKNPDALICNAPKGLKVDREQVERALANCNLSPQADPNTPSHTIRVMKAVALVQMWQMDPTKWKYSDVARRVAAMVGIGSIDNLLAPPAAAAGPDPKDLAKLGELQVKMAELADREKDRESKEKIATVQAIIKILIEQAEYNDRREQRRSSENIAFISEETERMKLAQGSMVHPEATGVAKEFAGDWPTVQPPAYPQPPINIPIPPMLMPPKGRLL